MAEPGEAGALYIVSTPIGNMGDMSFRAVEVLSSAALVIAEDTRHSRRLLDHYEIKTKCSAYHEHNEARETPRQRSKTWCAAGRQANAFHWAGRAGRELEDRPAASSVGLDCAYGNNLAGPIPPLRQRPAQ